MPTTYRVKTIREGSTKRYAIIRKVERIGRLTHEAAIRFPNHGTSFAAKADADIVAYWLRKTAEV